jgi:uncharacterized protein YggL (DUF469 family)
MEKEQETLSFKIESQKELAKYKKKQEFHDALHIIRNTRQLRAPEGVQDFLGWVAEMNGNANEKNGVGCFFHCYKTIASAMKCSERKVQDAIKWLKDRALITVIQFEETYYKVFADIETITIMVNALVEHRKNNFIKKVDRIKGKQEIDEIVRKYVSPYVSPYVSNKRPYIKDQDNKDIEHNRYEIDEIIPSSNKNGVYKAPKINPQVTEVVDFFQWHDLQPEKVAIELQLALNHTKTEITDENFGKLWEAVSNVWSKIEKKKKAPKNPYAYIKKCFETSLKGFFTEIKIENGEKVVHEHHYYHHREKPKSPLAIFKELNPEEDFFAEEKEKKPERKETNPEFMAAFEEQAATIQPKRKGKKIIKSDVGYLPEWFNKSKDKKPEPKYEGAELVAKKNEIDSLLAAVNDSISPKTAEQGI